MYLRVLGSGTVSTPKLKNCSGYLVNDNLLLDFGPGIWRALGINNISHVQIKYIVFSHFHVDHVSDFAPFLLQRYLSTNYKKLTLTVIGPIGLKEWFNKLSELFGAWMHKLPLNFIENKKTIKLEEYAIYALENAHTENSFCFRIEDKNKKSLFYSGDSDENENLKKLANQANLAIFESSNTIQTKIKGHMTPKMAANIANDLNIQKLLLTHFYPEIYESDELKKAKKIFKNDLYIASDQTLIEF